MVGFIKYAAAAAALVGAVQAQTTHYFNWTTGYVNANPDGVLERRVIACNGQYPWPDLRVNTGDRVIINLYNGMPDQNTSLHFHGLFQEGSTQMDGPEMVTQCPIVPGEMMVYNFTVPDQAGSYWYHSHTKGQYEDGMKGLFIIDKEGHFPYDYDVDTSLDLQEWYHEDVVHLTKKFMNLYNPTGAEPIPQNLLINNTRNLTWNVEPNTTYLLRIVNTGGFVSQYFWIEDHEMTVVEVDGIVTKPNTTDMLYITVAQRYTVLVTTKNDTSRNFAIMQKFDDTMLDVIPKELELNATSFMVYNNQAPMPEQNKVDELAPLDDFYLVPYQSMDTLDEPDYRITVDVVMDNLISGKNYAFFNNLTYVAPKVPTLASVMSSGNNVMNAAIYGSNTHSFVLQKDEVVEIVLNNNDTGKHPFHLHGHVFQTIVRAPSYDEDGNTDPVPYDPENAPSFPSNPMRRDTLYVNPLSHFVIRFKADNPGVWFFHCHIEWHLLQGLALTLIEAPDEMQSDPRQQLTDNWKQVCKAAGIDVEGNAAGNSADWLNLKGENIQEKNIPAGFTTKGIVAFVFSCIAGVIGLVSIAVYGLMDIKDIEEKVIEELDIDIDDVVDKSEREAALGPGENSSLDK